MNNEQIETHRTRILRAVHDEVERNPAMGVTPLMLVNMIAQNDILICQNVQLLKTLEALENQIKKNQSQEIV